ncbi:hypothetical protein HA466_0072860 [Hirschfeldia incana]|nr:hypothetical protein HA466_0072860 [Hirschfeldia incana]
MQIESHHSHCSKGLMTVIEMEDQWKWRHFGEVIKLVASLNLLEDNGRNRTENFFYDMRFKSRFILYGEKEMAGNMERSIRPQSLYSSS